MEYNFKKNRLTGETDTGDEFWEGLEEGVFRLPRCASCKRSLWESGTATIRCFVCDSWAVEWAEVEPTGVVYAWIRSNRAFPGVTERQEDVPYVTMDVELGGPGGPRVLGVLKGSSEGLKVGARVEGSIDPPSTKSQGYPSVRWTIV